MSVYTVDMTQLKEIPIFWLKKTVTKVIVNDFNKNGVWDVDDCRTAAEKIVEAGRLTGTKAEEVSKFYCENIPPYFHTATNLTEWLIEDFRFRNEPHVSDLYYNHMSTWFKVLDLDNDGVIDFHEFKVFWKAYDLDPRYMKYQFDYIDEDKDGTISCKEFVNAGFDYFYNTQENSNMFWGPVQEFPIINSAVEMSKW